MQAMMQQHVQQQQSGASRHGRCASSPSPATHTHTLPVTHRHVTQCVGVCVSERQF